MTPASCHYNDSIKKLRLQMESENKPYNDVEQQQEEIWQYISPEKEYMEAYMQEEDVI